VGIGDRYSKKKNALTYLFDKLYNGEDIELYYGGEFIRDFVHVDDVCRIMYKLMDKSPKNEIYNIGFGYPHTFKDVVLSAKDAFDSESKVTAVEPSDFHKIVQVKDFYMDINKIKSLRLNASKGIYYFIGEYWEHRKNAK
jgi:nucleoside-diphosphate-sugar epimerase